MDINPVDWTGKVMAAPYLGEPEVVHGARNTIELRWPDVKHPPAAVFYNEPLAGGRARLRVSFPGAREAAWVNLKLESASPFSSYILQGVRKNADGRDDPPQLLLRCNAPIWGYDMRCDEAQGFRIVVRAQPDLPQATDAKPLAGLRVMVDAGHGGRDLGAVGPSGLLEADVNLVQAAWLHRELEARGAIVKQTRIDDTYPTLDQRVELAWNWDPDLFVSLHHNSMGFSSDPLNDKGPKMFFHYDHARQANAPVAEALTDLLAEGTPPRTIYANFRLSRNISLCPVIYTETGFLTHPEDEIRLRRGETIRASAVAIAHGVTRLFENRLPVAADE
jgi:N-acetylmuramoyl-L-alanine amidase